MIKWIEIKSNYVCTINSCFYPYLCIPFFSLSLLGYCASHFPSVLFSVSLFFFHLHLCWTERTQPVRHRPGIFLCPSSPTLSLLGSATVGCGNGSAPRAATSPLLSSVHSDPTLLRKSVSFTEDLLLGASGTVGLCCISGVMKRSVDTQITQTYWTALTRQKNNPTCMLLVLKDHGTYPDSDLSMWFDVFGNYLQNMRVYILKDQ